MSFKHIDKLKKVNLDIPFKSPDYVKEYNKIYRAILKDDPEYILKMKLYRKSYYNSICNNEEYKHIKKNNSHKYYVNHKEDIKIKNHRNYMMKKDDLKDDLKGIIKPYTDLTILL